MDDATLMKLFETLNQKLESVMVCQAKMEGSQEKLTMDVRKVQITLENETNRNINLLMDGQKGTREKFAQLDRIEQTLEDVKTDVGAIKLTVQKHTSDITDIQGELKIVK